MPPKIDLTGQRFGKLVVLKENGKNKSGHIYWDCQCDCGNHINVNMVHMRNGTITACKNCRRTLKDLTGQKFGYLTVINEIGPDKNRNIVWKCQCDCGKIIHVFAQNLIRNHTISCGCYNSKSIKERNFKHGQATRKSTNQIYYSWSCMLKRCYNPNEQNYHNYGGRGIKVCKRWWKFKNFYKDMGNTYKQGLTLERIDNDGDYRPSNCKWATRQEQSWNKRNIKGCYWDKRRKKWISHICINYKQIYLGAFDTEEEAHQTYLTAKKKYHRKDT